MNQKQSAEESMAPPVRRRRWLRWLLVSLLLATVFLMFTLGSVIAYEQVRPLPDIDRLPPVNTAKPYGIIATVSKTNTKNAGRMPALIEAPTSAPLLAVPPPWPPIVIADNAPQILKDQAAPFARMQTHLEECRQAYATYAAEAPRLDAATSKKRLKELDAMNEEVDEEKDDIRDRVNYRQNKLSPDPIKEIGKRVNELRDADLRFALDHAIRFENWREAGKFLYYTYGDWDRAVYYWRKAGMQGRIAIGEATVDRLDRAFWRNIGNPVENYFEDLLGVNL